jgi:hypothetical protein
MGSLMGWYVFGIGYIHNAESDSGWLVMSSFGELVWEDGQETVYLSMSHTQAAIQAWVDLKDRGWGRTNVDFGTP